MFQKRSISKVDLSLFKCYRRLFQKETESLRNFLLESPTQYQDVFLHFDLTRLSPKIRKKKDQIGLAIISWYFPEEIRFLVQLELRETWDPESRELGDLLLTSKDFAITWLICRSNWTESDFFGNVLNKDLSSLFASLSFQRKSRRKIKRYTGYCRGFQDSSRGAPSPLPVELFANWTVERELKEKILYENKRRNLFQQIERDLQDLKSKEILELADYLLRIFS